ncbi:hypothetical protein [Desulfobacter latus]|uniref:Uncharacterized protein n=1 Tax=Desulfobacter latus TaxID=2292 RepID=A0A850SWV7_9BACT|nr:hypothetical protein [Desulfobacter latus]NWH05629.1 hypothetical protein [Desulfobacter latus]
MGTDRELEYEGPCECGEGKYIIKFCEPDHGWSNNFWYEYTIQCKRCAEKYELDQRGNKFYLVEKKELERKQKQLEKCQKKSHELMTTEKVKKILEKFITHLDALPSMAAIHRLLSYEKLECCSVATFRKRWNGGTTWVERNVNYFHLVAIMKILGITHNDIIEDINEIEELSKVAALPPKTIGKPVYETRL